MKEITGSIRLRTLTFKSCLWFGKYEGMTVQKIIDIHRGIYLRWIYYNISGISFTDDVLTSIGILPIYKDSYNYNRFRIEKPGTNKELGNELSRLRFFDFTSKGIFNITHIINIQKYRMRARMKREQQYDRIRYSKASLQRLNHGKKIF